MIRIGRPPPAIQKPEGKLAVITSFYYDPFKWSLVKSVGMFLLGVEIARQFDGAVLMPAA
ncbi:unnamed protein product [Notodromas monacha]|uniref:Uncharacterized protein n=1 Tax=Notodromas monacha TaxID=399045 RepID=A0A7R9C0M4_9CRUS|nr:unnamed protein product [Notodromas monacha]CAD7283811.1 unnamed protein product [Notodromas monacha]CAG0923758.1 unnamed protein product [Notodromas monacha]CAG0923963.1 unnamed protein product [Notodromas monacha]